MTITRSTSKLKSKSTRLRRKIADRYDRHLPDPTTAIAVHLWINLDGPDEGCVEVDALSLPCPKCEADIGEECIPSGSDTDPTSLHTDRRMTAATLRILFNEGVVAS